MGHLFFFVEKLILFVRETEETEDFRRKEKKGIAETVYFYLTWNFHVTIMNPNKILR